MSTDAISTDASTDADGPDLSDADAPEERSEALGELDLDFASSQETPGLFIGPLDLRADPSALSSTSDDGVIIAGRGRFKSEGPKIYSMRMTEGGEVDAAYGNNGGFQTFSTGPIGRDFVVLAGAIQADGKSLICGNVRAAEMGRSRLFVARLNPDGSPDVTFGTNVEMPGRVFFDLPEEKPNSLCWALEVLQDETILVGGLVAANNKMTPLLMRLRSNGALDESFGALGQTPGVVLHQIDPSNNWLYAKIRELEVLEDGKILGLVDSIDGTTGQANGYLLRFHPDGRIDESFGDDGEHPGLVGLALANGASHEVFDFAVDSADGRIFVVGEHKANAEPTPSRFFVHALDSNGRVVGDFATAGTYILDDYNAAARAISLQPNGKLLVTGSAMTHPNPALQAGELLVVRLMGDGTLDTSFAPSADTPGVFFWGHPTYTFYAARAVLDSVGRLAVVGSSPNDVNQSPRGHGFVVRLR
ncbi:hypothetical protein [Bradymonas sediminis]|uniref:hypothetical protein n=1 Tax=Bradymonas sediminis TaxID=1548548 RepID=UPI0013A6E419|nr:hypothetical protein [Bradymonas sediminis]